jgi:hypothetical protein
LALVATASTASSVNARAEHRQRTKYSNLAKDVAACLGNRQASLQRRTRSDMVVSETDKLALLWRGNRLARSEATPQNNRLNRVFEASAALGIEAEPAIYAEDMSR